MQSKSIDLARVLALLAKRLSAKTHLHDRRSASLMAQKAAKTTAKRNTQVLNRVHIIAAIVNGLFVFIRALVLRSSFSRTSLLLYVLLSAPALVIEFLFERNSRPKFHGKGDGSELRSSGEELDAKGLTEWMWDVLYWSWGCTGFAALVGDQAWWFWLAIPAYSAWLAYTTFGSVHRSMSELGGPAVEGTQGSSKRQQKLKKRGVQTAQYH